MDTLKSIDIDALCSANQRIKLYEGYLEINYLSIKKTGKGSLFFEFLPRPCVTFELQPESPKVNGSSACQILKKWKEMADWLKMSSNYNNSYLQIVDLDAKFNTHIVENSNSRMTGTILDQCNPPAVNNLRSISFFLANFSSVKMQYSQSICLKKWCIEIKPIPKREKILRDLERTG